MAPQGGSLIAALLLLAIATGCRSDKRPGEAAHGGPPRRAEPTAPADIAAVEKTPSRPADTTRPAPRPGLGEAGDELNTLAQDARRLRGALLNADFRNFNDKTKEPEDDSR